MSVMFKCKMCGGDLALTQGSTIATCDFCGSRQTVPNNDDDKKLALFERADQLRRSCDFDKAAGVYESIVSEFRHEAEAYWGLVLCKYGIDYVDDPASGKKVPTCHRCSFDSVLEDPNFDLAMENADPQALQLYRSEAKQIEQIREGIVAVSNNEDPYDIFICYKETDRDGDRTIDSLIAQEIYDGLTEKGYRVFFSRISLEDKLGIAYEPYIFSALNHAKLMLVVGTAYEHFNAVWVKNEWSRFLKFMETDKTKRLIPCFKGIDAYDIPREFAHLQAQDMGKVGAMQDLLRGVEKILPKAPAQATKLQRPSAPVAITNVSSIGTCDYNNLWPTGEAKQVFDYDEDYVICFLITVSKQHLSSRQSIKLGTAIYNEQGVPIMNEETNLAWAPHYDRLSKTFYIRGSDGSVVPTGKYRALFWVDEFETYEYHFTVTSAEEIERNMWASAEFEQAQREQWRKQGRCRHCGGTLKKGLLFTKCSACGKKLDY